MDTSADYYQKEILVLGVGNILFQDDGFGPAVADYLNCNYKIPDSAAVVNLGLSTRGFIFDILLSDQRPKLMVIVDAMPCDGRQPGQVFEVPLDSLIKEKIDDFSFHQGPTSNLLKELRDICGVEVVIIACQPQNIPGEMMRGLSEPLKKAVPEVSELIYNKYLNIT
jgi:coenzyme F420 hydrogenase subunit delta